MNRRHIVIALSVIAFAAALPLAHAAQPLKLTVYNPGAKGIFPVTSTIISGEREAVLIDAQFQRNDAQALVEQLRASGKTLTTVYISHSDPDYYFGLDVIQAAFPSATIVATAQTVEHIKSSMDGKLAYWAPILKDNAPKKLVLPEVVKGDKLVLEGKTIEIRGPNPERTYVWIPSLKTVTGGIVVSSGIHVWVADTQTVASRKDWQTTLNSIAALKPTAVVPGHYLGKVPKGLGAVTFTGRYLQAFDIEVAKAKDSVELVAAMKRRYPNAGEPGSLDLSAKVIKGEMKWPQ